MAKCLSCHTAEATTSIYMGSVDDFGADLQMVCEDCYAVSVVLEAAPESFVICNEDCEVNGYREYLVDADTMYRVRLFKRTKDDVKEAIERYRQGLAEGTLCKMPL